MTPPLMIAIENDIMDAVDGLSKGLAKSLEFVGF